MYNTDQICLISHYIIYCICLHLIQYNRIQDEEIQINEECPLSKIKKLIDSSRIQK